MLQQIPVKLEWEQSDPDGSQCPFCGDPIYLVAFYPLVFTRSGKLIKKITKPVCGSCKEIIEQEYM